MLWEAREAKSKWQNKKSRQFNTMVIAFLIFTTIAGCLLAVHIYRISGKNEGFWFGQANYWRDRSRRIEKENQENLAWRAAYERALALPIASNQECLSCLWARAHQGDELAESILCERQAIEISARLCGQGEKQPPL